MCLYIYIYTYIHTLIIPVTAVPAPRRARSLVQRDLLQPLLRGLRYYDHQCYYCH